MSGESNAIDSADFGDVDLSDLRSSLSDVDAEESIGEKDFEDKSESKEEGIEESEDSESIDVKADEKPEEKKEVVKESKEKVLKSIEAMAGNKKLALDPETEISMKIDGKAAKVKLQDLINDHSGKVAYNKKFQDLGEDKKKHSIEKLEFQQESSELVEKAKAFSARAKSGDAMGALEILAELAGVDPLETVKSVKAEMLKLAEKYTKMSEVERKSVDLEDTVRYYQKKNEQASENAKTHQTQAENEKKISAMQKTHGISDEKLVEVYDKVRQAKKGDVSVQDLENHFLDESSQGKASNILSSISPDLSSEGNIKIVSGFMRQNPGISEKILVQMIKDEIGIKEAPVKKSPAKVISDRIRKSSPNIKFKEEQNEEDNDFADFDDVTF